MSFPLPKESFIPKMNFFFYEDEKKEKKVWSKKWGKLLVCACAIVLLERTTLAASSPDLLAVGCRKQCSGDPQAVLQVTW